MIHKAMVESMCVLGNTIHRPNVGLMLGIFGNAGPELAQNLFNVSCIRGCFVSGGKYNTLFPGRLFVSLSWYRLLYPNEAVSMWLTLWETGNNT